MIEEFRCSNPETLEELVECFESHFMTPATFTHYQKEAATCKKIETDLARVTYWLRGHYGGSVTTALFNAGGQKYQFDRRVLTELAVVDKFASIFSGAWDKILPLDSSGRIFLDFDVEWVRPIFEDYLMKLSSWNGELDTKPALLVKNPLIFDEIHAIASYFEIPFTIPPKPIPTVTPMFQIPWLDSSSIEFLEAQFPATSTSHLIFKGSRDGFSARAFHEKCDDLTHLLVIVRDTLHNVFGCFTNASKFDVSSRNEWTKADDKHKPFLFTLQTNGKAHHTIDVMINPKFGLHYGSEYGVRIGGVFCLDDGCNLPNKSNYHYRHSRDAHFSNHAGYSVDTIVPFTVADYEVYVVNTKVSGHFPPPPSGTPRHHREECPFYFAWEDISVPPHTPREKISKPVMPPYVPHAATANSSSLVATGEAFHTMMRLNDAFAHEVHECRESLLEEATPVWNEIRFAARYLGIPLPQFADHSVDSMVEELTKWMGILRAEEESKGHMFGEGLVVLNCRDVLFTIAQRTVLQHVPENCLLAQMVSERAAFDIDGDGNVAIDEDPDLFRVVLNHLRFKELLRYNTTSYVAKMKVAADKRHALEHLLVKLGLSLSIFPIKTVR